MQANHDFSGAPNGEQTRCALFYSRRQSDQKLGLILDSSNDLLGGIVTVGLRIGWNDVRPCGYRAVPVKPACRKGYSAV